MFNDIGTVAVQRRPLRLALVLVPALLLPARVGAVPSVTGPAPADKVLMTYGGKAVTCRGLTLLTWRQIQCRLHMVARYVKRPLDGDWPSMQAGPLGARHGPIMVYHAPCGASVIQVLRGMCRDQLQSILDNYLVEKVRLDFAGHHSFDYRKHFHVLRLRPYNMARARAWDAYCHLLARFAENTWGPVQTAAATRKALPHLSTTLVAEWASRGTAPDRINPGVVIMYGFFPVERRGMVAPWYKKGLPDICFRFPIRTAISARRAKYTRIVARWLGNSGFVVAQQMLPRDEPEVRRIIQSCTGPHGRISRLRLALIRICSWLLGAPTAIDPGVGGNYSYFSGLTGLPAREISPQEFIPLKGRPHSFLFIFQKNPTIKKVLVAMNMSSFLWDVGEGRLLKPSAKRVWAKLRIVVPWLVKPSVKQLVHWSSASDLLPATRLFGFPLPQLVRRKYRREKW